MTLGFEPSHVPDKLEIEEAFADYFFDQKKRFLAQSFVPKLALSFQLKLERLMDIAGQLNLKFESESSPVWAKLNSKCSTLMELCRAFQDRHSLYQLSLMSTSLPDLAARIVNQHYQDYLIYAQSYCKLFEAIGINQEIPEVKISERIDPMEIHAAIINEQYNGVALREYARLLKCLA